MKDSTITRLNIRRLLKKEGHSSPYSSFYDQTVTDAFNIGQNGFSTVSIIKNILHKKPVYRITKLSEMLVIRHISENIRDVTSVKQDNRAQIVNCISNLMSEGIAFRLYKFDVKSFYESVNVDIILNKLENDYEFSGQSVRAARSFFDVLNLSGVSGLPRGMSLSATLAEYLMKDFDQIVSNLTGVWFYARFVDDIIIITSGEEDFTNFSNITMSALAAGLSFSKQKSLSKYFERYSKAKVGIEDSFSFLGYHFYVSRISRNPDNKFERKISIDIAPSKVRKIKTRILKSLLSFKKTGNFSDLLERIKLLTSNYYIIDRRTGEKRAIGIFYNYPLVSATESTSLPELDRFLLNAISSPHPKNKFKPILTKSQRQQILGLRFIDGFKNKRFFSFPPKKLNKLTRCWIYV